MTGALLAMAAGAAIAVAPVIVIAGRRPRHHAASPAPSRWRRRWAALRASARVPDTDRRVQRARLIGWTGAGVAVWALTGWPVAGAALTVVGLWAPWLLGSARVARERIERLEALEAWCRRMADMLAGGGRLGLAQAITASAEHTDPRIAPAVSRLARRLRDGEPEQGVALREFADDLDDRVGDTVAAALLLALSQQSTGVAAVLRQLADGIAADVRGRRQVEAERAESRQSMRMLLIIQAGVLAMIALSPRLRRPLRHRGRAGGDGRAGRGHPGVVGVDAPHRGRPVRAAVLRDIWRVQEVGRAGAAMNATVILVLAAGLLAGVGVALVAAAVVPGLGRARPRLADVLAALDERIPATERPRERWWVVLARRLPGQIPTEDLVLLGISRDRFVVGRMLSALGYAAAGPALAAVLSVLDAQLPLVIPGAITLLGAVAGWGGYRRRVEDRAEAMREEMRTAIVSYLQQVSLLRHGGAGVATALTVPARLLDDSWAMRRIRHELDVAERGGQMPWNGLRNLAAATDVDELADLSTIAATAGQDGGAVIATLLARAQSLHDELLADQQADAHRASGQMSTPGALQVALITVWVLYPAAAALLAT